MLFDICNYIGEYILIITIEIRLRLQKLKRKKDPKNLGDGI